MPWLTSGIAGMLRRRGPGGVRVLAAVTGVLAAVGVSGVVSSAVPASASPGLIWTQQHPATSPPARKDTAMTYDAATGTVVLFGGFTGNVLGDTWTWNGSTWTQQHPAASPPARFAAAMASDAPAHTPVLFGGYDNKFNVLGDTWTWNGSTWTHQHPATSPAARDFPSMASDAPARTPVLFGGGGKLGGQLADTWAWGAS